ncbi:hypothetical protein ADK64_28490 [Streptomyces sp. MMG1121]|nr:hypothetical protein ADK64_28490 [Streptomyces sp. MMG1121]
MNYPTQTTSQYELAIRGFFRVHPLFEVKAFDNHKREFPFPAAHCKDGQDDDDREDGARPHGGRAGDGSGSTSPSPQKGRESTAASWRADLLSTKYIVIAAGGLLIVLGMLAMAWLRRRRSAE